MSDDANVDGASSVQSAVQEAETRAAQRGFFVITGGKVWFLLTGIVLNIGLPRILGDPARFGDFGVVNTLISIVNMVIIAGALQVVSKRVSESPDAAFTIRRHALGLMVIVGSLLTLFLLAGADYIATHIFHDPSLADLIRVASIIVPAYGFYAVAIGLINGLKRFTQQALFDIGFATIKVTLIIGLVVAGFGVIGAFAGFAAAAVTISLVAFIITRRYVQKPLDGTEHKVSMAGFMFQVMGYTLFVNILVQGDVLVVKSATYQPVLDALTTGAGKDRLALIATVIGVNPDGLAPILAPESTAILTGLYRATKNVSLISYQAVIAITFVVFPLVSRATFQSDRNATQSYVSQTFRTALLLVSCVAVLIGAGGKPLLVFLFGNVYGLASASLLPLVGAMSCFALLFVVGSILTAGGRPGDAMWLAGLAAVLQMTALFLGMDDVAPDAEVLTWIATVTLASIGVPLLLACWVLSRRLEVRLPLLSAARALMVGALALLAVQPIPWMGIVGIAVRCLTAFVVFGVGLVVFREIGRKELEMVKRIVKRSKAG